MSLNRENHQMLGSCPVKMYYTSLALLFYWFGSVCVFAVCIHTRERRKHKCSPPKGGVFSLIVALLVFFIFFCQTTWLMVSNYTEGKIDRVTIIVLKWRVAVALVNVVQENKTFPWAALPRGTWERMLWCLLLVYRHVANKDDSDSANKRNVCYFMEYGGSWRGKEEILRWSSVSSVAHKYVVILANLNMMKNTSDILRHTPLSHNTFNIFDIIQRKLYSESIWSCVRGHNRKHQIQEIRNLNVLSVT